MNYAVTFDVSASGSEVNKRIASCLAQAGFVPVAGQPQQFKRGSLLGASFSFSPLKMPTTVSVATIPQDSGDIRVSLTYDVNTKGQMVTEQYPVVWQAELESLKQAILSGAPVEGGAKQAAARAVGVTWRGLLLWFGIWFVVGLVVAIAGVLLTGSTSFSYVGILVGGAVGYLVMQRYSKTTKE
jgi:hypothetical protein